MASNVDCSDSKTSAGSGGAFFCEVAHNSVPVPAEEGKSETEKSYHYQDCLELQEDKIYSG